MRAGTHIRASISAPCCTPRYNSHTPHTHHTTLPRRCTICKRCWDGSRATVAGVIMLNDSAQLASRMARHRTILPPGRHEGAHDEMRFLEPYPSGTTEHDQGKVWADGGTGLRIGLPSTSPGFAGYVSQCRAEDPTNPGRVDGKPKFGGVPPSTQRWSILYFAVWVGCRSRNRISSCAPFMSSIVPHGPFLRQS